jgi:antirestriction protein ArdC
VHPAQIKIIDNIISELERGTIPWRKQFETSRSRSGLPYNGVSGRPYSGFNVMVLLMTGYPIDGGWLTYKQAQDMGGNVRKGEKSTVIFYYSKIKSKEKKDNGDDKFYFMAKSYLVFHLTQCDNINVKKLHQFPAIEPVIINNGERNAQADKFIANTGASIFNQSVEHAFYNVLGDKIFISPIETYERADAYYCTLFHELAHWTGHEKRLARQLRNLKQSKAYGYEELIAELTACFTLPQFGMSNIENNAAYLASWIKILKETPEVLTRVASEAARANAFLNLYSEIAEARGTEIEDVGDELERAA